MPHSVKISKFVFLGIRSFLTAGSLAIFTCAAAATPSADTAITIFYNAHIFTAEYAQPFAEALAIRGDQIIAVGGLAEVEHTAGVSAKRIDLQGKFLMPGMIDAHSHPIAGGVTLIQARYPDTHDSVPDLLQFVTQQVDQKTSRLGNVVVIYDIDLGFWTQTGALDAALSTGRFTKQPIVLFGSDGHTAWANLAARIHAGITRKYVRGLAPTEQHYYGLDGNSDPNGFVVDVGKNKVDESLRLPSGEVMLAAGRAAVRYMNSQGITGWLDAAASGVVGGGVPASVKHQGFLPTYRELARRGELTAHVVAYPVIQPDLGFAQIDVVQALQSQYRDIPNFRMPGLKVFADGVVEIPSQTAALTKPYRNSGKVVSPLFTPAKMNALVIEADRRGLIVHVHAIGDLAVKASLDAFEAARHANPSSTLPHTMTHAQFVDAVDIPRFAQLHVIAALQLLWAVADPSTNEQVKPFIGPEIYRWMYPARALLESGAVIAGASDWPVSTANPFAAIYQAETRSGPQGVLEASQRMPREAMLYAYTRNSVRVLDQLDQIGSLAPGKLADLVLVDRDVLTVPAAELKDAAVIWTMLG